MAEPTTTIPTDAIGVDEDVFDFDDWLATGTVARRSVVFHMDMGLIAEYDKLERRLEAAERRAKEGAAGESSLGDIGGESVDTVIAEMESLWARWEASRAEVVVRALEEDEIRAIQERLPDPDVPEWFGDEMPPVGTPEFEARVAEQRAWTTARDQVANDRNAAMISAAIVEFTSGGRPVRIPTPEQVHGLRNRLGGQHGKKVTGDILQAIAQATSGEVEVPRPTWPGRSEAARG